MRDLVISKIKYVHDLGVSGFEKIAKNLNIL